MIRLNEDRFFSPDISVRKYARELYSSVRNLPIVSPHGHVDPRVFAENTAFTDPVELLILPDHYVFRMLYSRGIDMDDLGIRRRDGSRAETDALKIWQIFADNFYLFAGTPSGVWLRHELYEVFGISKELNSENGPYIYYELSEKLKSPENLPRAMYNRFNIEVLSTTDAAEDDLEAHKKIRNSDWNARIIPSFRPDSVTDLTRTDWHEKLSLLEKSAEMEIIDHDAFIAALRKRRQTFIEAGAKATDQGVVSPKCVELSDSEANNIFRAALAGKVSSKDAKRFTAHMLMKMAEMSAEDGLVMQMHPGVLRDHNPVIFEKYGPDKGADIPLQTEYTKNLKPLLNKYGNNKSFKLIVFTLDEDTYTRELAPMAGHYPSMLLGPAWWFNDSIEGMTRFRQRTLETAGFYNTVGFNDDTRAFPSIPARHDLARRIDANFLAEKVARHIISFNDAEKIIKALSYDLVKSGYNL